jgi:O-antigen/teichoic acid export membrane protein
VQLGAMAGFEAFEGSAQIQIWRGLLLLPCVFCGARAGGLLGAIAAMSIVSFLTFAAGSYVLRRECTRRTVPLRYTVRPEAGALTTSLSLWAGTVLLYGSNWAVTMMLSRQGSGLMQLGFYNAADRWKTALLFLPQVLFQVILPMLANSHAAGDEPACRRIVTGAFAATLAITGLGAVAVYLFAGVLMTSYGHDFAPGAGALTFAAAGAVAGGLYTVGSGVLWALGKPTLMLRIDLFRAFLLVGLCVAGWAASARQVMLASLISYAAASAIVLLLVRKQLTEEIALGQAGRVQI